MYGIIHSSYMFDFTKDPPAHIKKQVLDYCPSGFYEKSYKELQYMISYIEDPCSTFLIIYVVHRDRFVVPRTCNGIIALY